MTKNAESIIKNSKEVNHVKSTLAVIEATTKELSEESQWAQKMSEKS